MRLRLLGADSNDIPRGQKVNPINITSVLILILLSTFWLSRWWIHCPLNYYNPAIGKRPRGSVTPLQWNTKQIEVICLDFTWLPPPLLFFIACIPHLCYLTPFPPLSFWIILNLNELSSLLPVGREKRLICRSIFSVMPTLCSATLSLAHLSNAPTQTHTCSRAVH